MVSGKKTRIHGASSNFAEERFVDTLEMRLSEMVVTTHPTCVSVLRDRLMETFNEFNISVDTGAMQICMALEEAIANAFYHGTLELDSDLKEDGTNRFMEMARERCQLSPWKERKICVTELATPYGLWITIADEGNGFDVRGAVQRTEEPINMLASGRGLVMMRAFTDDLVFNQKGNEVTLVIYSNRNQDVTELLQERARSRDTSTGRKSLI